MDAILSPARLARDIEALAAGAFLQDPYRLIEEGIALLTPPERISTVDCAERYRFLPGPEDGSVIRYDRKRTPFNVGPMNSLDEARCELLVMVKPSRSGGTAVVENHLFKRILFGPMGHVSWVLNSDEAVTDYCRTVVKPMFELNEGLQARVGTARGEDTDSYKLVRGYPIEWLSAKDSTFRNRQPVFMVSDETDAWTKRYAKSPKTQIDGRQKLLGNRRKGAMLSHPDLGFTAGVAAAYEDSSRGVYVMQCTECLDHAVAYAPKFWGELPMFRLHWERALEAPADSRLDLAERTACLLCPHCGAALDDAQRKAMVERATSEHGNSRDGWMHRGQTLDPEAGVVGDPDQHPVHGYWVHGTMLTTETAGKLAREYEAALIDFERTRDATKLKEFMSKQLGEVYEGAATTEGVSANALKARVRESGFERGTAPPEVKFVTVSVDTGARKFDVLVVGWDLHGRSWIIDRVTKRQRRHPDGEMRDLHLKQNIDDWNVLWDIADRTIPIVGRPGWALPVACITVDSGDGNVTWKAREFARRSQRKGHCWGKWDKFRLIKGDEGKKPILPDVPRKVDKDEHGRAVEPVILEYTLGADRLKDLTYERLAVIDGSPGEVSFAAGIEANYIDEFFGETKTDGKWRRHGSNETLDLFGYAEAARLILRPDRADIRWNQDAMPPGKKWTEACLPPWARPVCLEPEGGDPAAPAEGATASAVTKASIYARIDALNRRGE